MRTSLGILALFTGAALIAPVRADPAPADVGTAPVSEPVRVASLAAPAPAAVSEADRNRVVAVYTGLPLSFERNEGQTDPRVNFLARGDGYTLFLTPAEAVLVLRQPTKEPSEPRPGAGLPSDVDAQIDPARTAPAKVKSSVLRMKLLDANTAPVIEGHDELPAKSNYFIGNDPERWRTRVPRYTKVGYAEVYPGIDLVFYGNQRRLEYDFVVAPGADPGAIHLSFEGADGMRVDDAGNLVLAVPGGELIQHAPLIYQEIDGTRRRIPGRYVLEGKGQSRFRVAAYDTGRALVIDPVLSYSTYLGGSYRSAQGGRAHDDGVGIAVDSVGNVYVTGQTGSIDFPTLNAYQGSFGGGSGYWSSDAFVTKLDPTAAGAAGLLYSTYLGGNENEHGTGIAVDSAGNVYVAGVTGSTDFPTLNAYQASKAGGADTFVTKLDPTAAGAASLLYSTYLGGTDGEGIGGIAVDSAGNAYVTGSTSSTNFPTLNAYQASKAGGTDTFVTKLDPTAGAAGLLYSTYLGGSNDDMGWGGIAVDSAGNVYVTGRTHSTDFPTLNAYQGSFGGGTTDAFVAKLDPTAAGAASLPYSTYLGGNERDYAYGIAVDSAGNVYVTGVTYSTDFPTLNAYQGNKLGPDDAFVTVLDPTAAGAAGLLYSTYLGGTDGDGGGGIAVDSVGNAYVTGNTLSTDFPTLYAFQEGYTEGWLYDGFVTKLDPSAAGAESLLYSTYLGGSNEDEAIGIAVDSVGNVYVTGYTTSWDFPITPDAFQASIDWTFGSDAFVTKLELGPFNKILRVAEATIDDSWQTVAVPPGLVDPVVFAGPPTFRGHQPGVVRLRNVGPNGFEVRFQEWAYLDGIHTEENVPFIIIEPGRHVLPDGSVLEAGRVPVGGTGVWQAEVFSAPFERPPALFLTAQTADGPQPVTVRARNVTGAGFEVALFEEEALMDGHAIEEVGYLAVHSPKRSGVIGVGGVPTPYLIQSAATNHRFTPILSSATKLEEEQSLDSERRHRQERLSVLALGDKLFAQVVTSRDDDTVALRRLAPDYAAPMEWGTVAGVSDEWTTVPLTRNFTDPVVVATPVSARGGDPGVIRLRNVTGESFELKYQEWRYLNGEHGGERVFYLVVEAGQWDLAGLAVEAGTLDTNSMLGDGGELVGLSAPFTGTPAVFTSVMTFNGSDPVVTRTRNPTSLDFVVTMQEAEASAGVHVSETLGWIAVEQGSGITSDDRAVQVGQTTANHLPAVTPYGFTTNRRFPVVIADTGSTNESDPVFPRFENLRRHSVELFLQEEQSLDAEQAHALEDLFLFVAE